MKLSEPFKNTLRRVFDPIFTQVAVSAGYRMERDIPLALQRLALSTTAEYVLAKMNNAPVFATTHDLLGWAAKKCRDEPGLVLEFGVWKGASLKLLAEAFDQTVYGFDSFQGLPEDWRSGMSAGTFALERPPAVPANAELVVGWFNRTLDGFFLTHPGPIKLLHIDCDLYSSTRDVLDRCADRLRPGSIIVFDEYLNYPGWQEGEFRAFQEAVTMHKLAYRYLGYVRKDEQVAVELTSATSTITSIHPSDREFSAT